MSDIRNPFEFVGANDLPPNIVVDYYIEDFNYSRFIQSKRNILLVGERGCGKSMTLIYNSWPLQQIKADREKATPTTNLIGVYVPCNTHLVHKREDLLLNDFRASVISEHFLVLSITYAIAETLSQIPSVLNGADTADIRARLEFIFDTKLPLTENLFQALMDFIQNENLRTQRAINDRDSAEIKFDGTYSFASLVVPILGITRAIPNLKGSHYLLLIDDAHDLNGHQLRALASWIAYRDHSLFSFKVALANVETTSLRTASGGSILEGHDYIRLDMAQPLQNEASDFGKLAERLINRRLKQFNISVSPAEFFPESEQLLADLKEAEGIVTEEARQRYSDDAHKISDYVYKHKRSHYFRNRSPRANRPEYSGFSTLVYLSTGVIRNLLIPCHFMFDKVISLGNDGLGDPAPITNIPPNVQSEVILERSRALWDWLRSGIDQNINGCSREDAIHCYNLLDQLAIHFRERLMKHRSEPRANSFTISRQTESAMQQLAQIFRILKEAQLLYMRSGSAKDKGKREWYYVPNRLLWPERGLDPHGQHARVSLPAADLVAAAFDNKAIAVASDEKERESSEIDDMRLFDESL